MRHFSITIFAIYISIAMASNSLAQTDSPVANQLKELLFDLPDVRFEQIEEVAESTTFMLNVKQPVDHNDETKGFFFQRVLLVHRSFESAVVMNTNGYTLESNPMELFELLEANSISVEHRYFGPSSPSPKDWDYLTIQQAAADYHRIRELLGEIYKGKWVATGISKGGETCSYYKYFYPEDVDLCIPYVAPFPNGLKDQRFYKFLDNVGTEECREKMFQYQNAILENKEDLVPMFTYYLKGRGAKVDLIGGPEAALELIVMEYPFSFWQTGKRCEDIPGADATDEELLDHLIDSGDYWYLLDDSTTSLAAHYYQHATQFGYYGYRAERFGDLIKHWDGEPSACFFPYAKDLEFDGSLRKNLTRWMQTEASDMLFIYGETDTWTVAQADTGENQNVAKFILEGKHHGTARIRLAEKSVRDEIMKVVADALK